jgi:hypothetical protein
MNAIIEAIHTLANGLGCALIVGAGIGVVIILYVYMREQARTVGGDK